MADVLDAPEPDACPRCGAPAGDPCAPSCVLVAPREVSADDCPDCDPNPCCCETDDR